MSVVLIIIAVLAGIAGGLSLSNATQGVGLICGGCLAAILARIWQAAAHHEAAQAALKEMNEREAKRDSVRASGPASSDGWPRVP